MLDRLSSISASPVCSHEGHNLTASFTLQAKAVTVQRDSIGSGRRYYSSVPKCLGVLYRCRRRHMKQGRQRGLGILARSLESTRGSCNSTKEG